MTISITGVDEVKDILNNIAPRHARNLMRATIQSIASTIAQDAKANAPKDTGTLIKAIKAKRKKSHPDKPISDVVIESGKSVKYDAFYWRFVEHGTGGDNPQPERPFIRPAADRVRSNFKAILTEEFGKKLEKALEREGKKRAKNGI